MPANQIINQIKNELQKNGFYKFLENQNQLAKKVIIEFNKSRSKNNPRNIKFHQSWSAINSYGRKRQLLLIELGGTFLKLFKIQISKKQIKILKSKKVDFYQNIIYTPAVLSKKIDQQLDRFFKRNEQRKLESCVFIFTFPLRQYIREDGILDGVCTNFAKQHKSKGLVGSKIGENLQAYLRTHGYPKIQIAVTNDSPPSLLAAKKVEIDNPKVRFDALVNIIVGTGTNIALGYNIDNRFFISNTEFGLFKSFPQSKYDLEMDAKTTSKGTYQTEKMFAGAWRAALFKEIYHSLIKEKILIQKIYQNLKIDRLESKDLDNLLNKRIKKSDPLFHLKFIWDEISYRGGYICGFALAQIITAMKKYHSEIEFGMVEVGAVLEYSKVLHRTMLETTNFFIEKNLNQAEHYNKITIDIINPKYQTVYGAAILDAFLHKKI
jgi:hexokinase